MMRVRNEQRWLRRSLERTFQVCETVVIWDDGSEDDSEAEAFNALVTGFDETPLYKRPDAFDGVVFAAAPDESAGLFWIRSPFRPARRPSMAASEIRDRNALWEFVKARLAPKYVLCLDGDEMLSQVAIRGWDSVLARMESGVDIVHFPFVFLWGSEAVRRVDGVYGPKAGLATLNFPRLFTLQRMSETQQFNTRFSWEGTRGGIHCGSIPREGFLIDMLGDPFVCAPPSPPVSQAVPYPIVHMGYIEQADRERKVAFYRTVDAANDVEGRYNHCLGLPDYLAPGPLEFIPWEDA